MSLGNYVIPKLPANRPIMVGVERSVDPREANIGLYASIFARRCVYCRNFHSENSYCFQIKCSIMGKHSGSRKRRRSPSDSESSRGSGSGYERSDSEEEGEILNESEDEGDSGGSEPEADHLKDFFGALGRVDDKDVTLALDKQTIKLYFSTVLGRGKFDRDGRDKMRDKYYLDPKQYDKFSPPDLLGTKLHLLDGLDFSGLSSRLQVTHSKLRDVVKVLLKNFQCLGEKQSAFGELQIGKVFDDKGALSAEYELPDISAYQDEDGDSADIQFSQENFKKVVAENIALKRKDKDFHLNYRFVQLGNGKILTFVFQESFGGARHSLAGCHQGQGPVRHVQGHCLGPASAGWPV